MLNKFIDKNEIILMNVICLRSPLLFFLMAKFFTKFKQKLELKQVVRRNRCLILQPHMFGDFVSFFLVNFHRNLFPMLIPEHSAVAA